MAPTLRHVRLVAVAAASVFLGAVASLFVVDTGSATRAVVAAGPRPAARQVARELPSPTTTAPHTAPTTGSTAVVELPTSSRPAEAAPTAPPSSARPAPAASARPAVTSAPAPVRAVVATPATAPAAPPAPACTTRSCLRRPGPPRVLLIGDSVLGEAEPDISRLLRARGLEPHAMIVGGTGLLSGIDVRTWATPPGGWSWFVELPRQVDAVDPDVIVMAFLGAYFPPAEGGVPYATPEFKAAWAEAAHRVTGIVTSRQATATWVLAPPLGDPNWADGSRMTTEAVRGLNSRWPATAYVDCAALFSGPDGGYTDTVTSPDGSPVVVREPDHIHLTDAGAALYASHVADRVATLV